jgi:hypothetical protein
VIEFIDIPRDDVQKWWALFAPHHYFYQKKQEKLRPNSQKYLVKLNGTIIGFAAASRFFGAPPCICGHKIVVLKSSEYDKLEMWARVSDSLAQKYTATGHTYRCNAPYEYAAYRDRFGSGWKPTSNHNPPNWCSHVYIGTPVEPSESLVPA